ncbi:Activating signal cointegrator 1 complex subunit 2 [Mactra antiquata]
MSPPLDKLYVKQISDKGKLSVPALDPRWIEEVQFVIYLAPPPDVNDKGLYEAWMERLKFNEDDLHWLLQLPHDKFWCQAIFDETLHRFLDSYLRHAPRSCHVLQQLPQEARDRHNEVHRLVFMTCLRMATYKESKDCHITPSVFGDILYENFIFDIPKLMDLCILYGRGNGTLLTKMIDNIFTQQPKYKDDLAQTVITISEVFDGVLGKCGIHLDSGSPQKLSDHGNKKQALVVMDSVEFKDIVLYLCDIGMTLNAFLEVYPAACQSFHDSEFLMRLPAFYESVIPELLTALKLRKMNVSERQIFKQQVLQAKKSLLTVYQTIISVCCIQPILDKRNNIMEYVEDYLHIIGSILSERRFLADYESLHSFQGDLEILSQASSEVDETRLQYIQDAVNLAFATFGKRKAPKGAMNRGGRRSPDGSTGEMEGAVGGVTSSSTTIVSAASGGIPNDAYQVEDMDDLGACSTQVSGVELESMISSVKDLLPELGDGFVELCLEEMGYNLEKVINAVLEDRLPQSLSNIDRTLPRKKRAMTPPSLIHQRKNVYDYDEFDVFHRTDIDLQKVRKGKMDKTKDIVIGDQTELKDIKSNISRDYSVIKDIVYDDGTDNNTDYIRDLYDDEYDDTYDANVVGADDADSADELSNIRPFTVPRVLGGGRSNDDNAANQDNEDSDEDTQKNPDHFIEDPAVIRQAAEDRAKWKAQRSKPAQGQPKKTYDVKGGPKGQGQSAEVTRNRRWKTQHKGDFKRAAADRKRKV